MEVITQHYRGGLSDRPCPVDNNYLVQDNLLLLSDGGFSDNLPLLDCETVTVSPFSGCADICPLDSMLSDILTVFVSQTFIIRHLLINLFSLLPQIDFANATFELSHQNLFRLQSVLSPPEASVLSE